MRDKYERTRKLKVNEEYFEKIDTQEKVYWLGFLFADGCVKENNGSYSVVLQLAEKDKKTIYKFKKSIKSEHKVSKYYDKRIKKTYYGISITSYKFAKNLINLGCCPRKTFTAEFPKKYVPFKLMNHFVRGYFDGDGSVFRKDKKDKYPIVSICVSHIFGIQLRKYLWDNVCIKKSSFRKSQSIYTIRLSSQQALSFLRWIYKDADIFLKRKYNRFLRACKDEEDRKLKRILIKVKYWNSKSVNKYDLNMNLLDTYVSIKEASIKTGMKYPGIRDCCGGKIKTSGGYKWRFKE